jgi:hypothetical protein
MKFTKGYKFQIEEDFSVQTTIYPQEYIDTWDIRLESNGVLTLKIGFAWDGASGPTIDTTSTMIPSAVHDALYKLMRREFLPIVFRKGVDQFFHDHLIKEGMWRLRAWYWYRGVRLGGGPSAKKRRKVYEV